MPNSDSFDPYLGEEVVDSQGQPIGTFACYWERDPGKPLLLGVNTSEAAHRTHVAPAKGAILNERHSCVQLGFDKSKVEQAPCLECSDELCPDMEKRVGSYYGINLAEEGIDAQLRRVTRPKSP